MTDVPISPSRRTRLALAALALLAGGLWLLSLQLGVSVGLFVGLWVFTLPALLVPLLVSHYRDSYQRRGGNR